MGKLAQAFFNAIGSESFSSDSEINKTRQHRECRYYHVNSVRPQPVVVLFSLGKKSQHRELH
jgi:hypothetical protein